MVDRVRATLDERARNCHADGLMMTAHLRLAGQAERQPDAPALLAGQASMTFGALSTSAQHDGRCIAEALGQCGADLASGNGDAPRIGLAIPRSIDLVSLVFGSLASGAAYVPLDPRLPTERLRYMAEDAGVSLVVLPTEERPPWLAEGIASISIADLRTPHCRMRNGALPGPNARSLAYVIYTSGSTGRPKGVRITHANLSLIVDAWRSVAHVTGGPGAARFLFHSTLSFDASLTEFLWPLTEGHSVVLAPDGARVGFGDSFGSLLEQYRVTHLQCTPTRAVLMLADADDRRGLRALQQVLIGGEALPPALVHQLQAAGVGRVTNIYGPTECSIWSFAHDVESTDGATVPIGFPLPGVRPFVVDESLRPVGDGIEGELLICGPFVGDGYHGRADLTSEKFRTLTIDGSALSVYRTGDRVIRRPDGVHEFLGRIDTQVKLRGYRIELGEVESVLIEQPSIAQAVTAVVGHGLGDDRLVAYVVVPRGLSFDEVGVRRAVATRLSPVMAPSLYVVMDEFPLTPSGKVDRRSLPEIAPQSLARATPGMGQEGRGTPLDRIVADFATVFGHPVDPDDDFFALGGHSLLAVDLLGRIAERKGIDLPLTVLLDAPTPRLLAERATNPGGFSAVSSLVRFGAEEAPVKLFLVHGAGGNVMGFREIALALRGRVEVIGVQAAGVEPGRAPDRSMTEMVERYATAIQADDPSGRYWIGGYSDGGLIALHLAQELRRRGSTIAGVVVLDSFIAEPMPPTLLGRLANVSRNARDRGGRSARAWVPASWRAWRARAGYVDANAEAAERLGYVGVDAIVDQAVLAAGDSGPIPAPALLFRSMEMTPTFWFDYSHVERRAGSTHTVWVPGGHATVFQGANSWLVADEVAAFVDRFNR